MINIDRNGNTTAATIPLCLYEYEAALCKGDNLILASFGGGYTWGSIYVNGLTTAKTANFSNKILSNDARLSRASFIVFPYVENQIIV